MTGKGATCIKTEKTFILATDIGRWRNSWIDENALYTYDCIEAQLRVRLRIILSHTIQ